MSFSHERLRKVRIEEVAEKAGVSTATVSRVLNHPEMVNERTRGKVLQVMHQMGYGNMQKPRSNVLLVLVPDAENSFYSEIFNGIYAAADRRNYQYVIRHSNRGRLPSEDTIRSLCQATGACGILTLSSASLEQLRMMEQYAPVVQCCECVDDPETTYVTIDDRKAAYNITASMIKNGRRRIAFVNNLQTFKYARQRRLGFEDAMREAGLEINPAWMIELASYDYMQAHSAVSQMFRLPGLRPDAVVTVSDTYGVAAIKAAKGCGFRVPEDVAVSGFDNLSICHLTEPTLTTVSQPAFMMGNLSCELLISRIENPNQKPQQIVLNTEIVVRGST